jgi:outer membrane immunogenic protein
LRIVSIGLATALVTLVPAHASAAEFDGPFAGAQVGWSSNEVRNPETSVGLTPIDDDKQALTGGVYAGYDKRLADRFVLGLEGGLDFASDDEVAGTAAGLAYTIDPKRTFDLTARAGYLVNPETLVYARGGYTNARMETSVEDLTGKFSATDNRDGWLVGAGVERQLMSNASARFEYRYSDLSEGDGSFDRHRVLAGISYRF